MAGPDPGTVNVRLPRALLQFWSGPAMMDLDARSLSEAFSRMEERVPGLSGRILDDQGRVRRHVMIFVNDERVEGGDPSRVPLRPGDRLHVVPSVSGG